jgi:uncharacterized phage-associated protein
MNKITKERIDEIESKIEDGGKLSKQDLDDLLQVVKERYGTFSAESAFNKAIENTDPSRIAELSDTVKLQEALASDGIDEPASDFLTDLIKILGKESPKKLRSIFLEVLQAVIEDKISADAIAPAIVNVHAATDTEEGLAYGIRTYICSENSNQRELAVHLIDETDDSETLSETIPEAWKMVQNEREFFELRLDALESITDSAETSDEVLINYFTERVDDIENLLLITGPRFRLELIELLELIAEDNSDEVRSTLETVRRELDDMTAPDETEQAAQSLINKVEDG